MAKRGVDEKLEALEERWKQKEIEDGIRKGLTRWAHTICISATSGAMAAFTWLGGVVYERWEPLKAAIQAYLAASRGQ